MQWLKRIWKCVSNINLRHGVAKHNSLTFTSCASNCTAWPYKLQDCIKFVAKFDNFLHEQNLHLARFLAEHQDALKASEWLTETMERSWMTVNAPTVKPSASTVTNIESHLAIIHNWRFSAEGFISNRPISSTVMFTKLCYQAAWNRESKHFVWDSENLKKTVGKLESDKTKLISLSCP